MNEGCSSDLTASPDPPSFEEQRQIVAAMAEIMENSCVHFVPRTKETDYIRIVRDGG